MNISLDYDDTYTRDPVLWNSFIESCINRGHIVYCVTARALYESDDVFETIAKLIGRNKCIFVNHASKRDFMKRVGIQIDVWIDDNVDSIVFGLNS